MQIDRVVGIVEAVIPDRRFGFVQIDRLGRAFMHAKHCPNFELPALGDRVSCRLEMRNRGLEAFDVEPFEPIATRRTSDEV